MWSDRLIEGQLISFRHCQGPVVARCVSDRRKIRTFRASASIPTNCISWPLKPRPTVTSMASSELPMERIDRKIRFFKFNFPNGHQRHLVVNAISIQNRRTRAVMEKLKLKNCQLTSNLSRNIQMSKKWKACWNNGWTTRISTPVLCLHLRNYWIPASHN